MQRQRQKQGQMRGFFPIRLRSGSE
jgi:hypothetical protein